MVVVGYDDEKNAYRIANSWGTDWADNGYGWIDYDFMKTLLDQDGAVIGIVRPNAKQRIS
jgi:C1A family cysteine protease